MNEMVAYCFIYPILTFSLFFIWMTQTTMPGGEIGMAPFLVGLVLLAGFTVEIVLVMVFKKFLISLKSKIIALISGFLIYEIILYLFTGEFAILNAFQVPFLEDPDGAYSLSSLISLAIILTIILWRNKNKTLHNTG